MALTSKLVILMTSWLIFCPVFALGLHHTIKKRTFYTLKGKSFIGNVTAERKVEDVLDCSFLCLEYGPSACLSFNFAKSSDSGYHSCELCNSEKYFEPHKIQDRSSHDHYGTTGEFLFGLYPCASSPCSFGGTCIDGPVRGKFLCQCKPAISLRPYIDDKCNIELAGVDFAPGVGNIYVGKVDGHYNLNYYDAERFCKLHGASLATYSQLYVAWQAGFEYCAFGWLEDGTIRYPMQTSVSDCGSHIGIVGSSKPEDKNRKGNAWCYKQ